MEDKEQRDLLEEQFLKQRGLPQASRANEEEENINLIHVLTTHRQSVLDILRSELRGEQLYQDEAGEKYWVQVEMPKFIKLDINNKPLLQKHPKTGKIEYIPNDEAINDIINILKSSGLNSITPLTALDENNIRADLMEIQSKIVVLLAVKRKKWGIDKEKYPVLCSEINTLIQDARYIAKEGMGMKAIRTITSRIEQANENQKPKTIGERVKSPFQ
jgi:hypothetical protein